MVLLEAVVVVEVDLLLHTALVGDSVAVKQLPQLVVATVMPWHIALLEVWQWVVVAVVP